MRYLFSVLAISICSAAPASAQTTQPVSPEYPDRDAQPIQPPIPMYPVRAAERGIEGKCEVHFDVDNTGVPYNIDARCTDPVFEREAERAVSKAKYAPKIVNDMPVERKGVVYPIQFRLQ